MPKRVILVLEYDMGDYTNVLKDGRRISTNPRDYDDRFYQADINLQDLDVVSVRVEGKLTKEEMEDLFQNLCSKCESVKCSGPCEEYSKLCELEANERK